ncbi:hypothetical protein ACOCEA_11990 [Maribacter sp. CXY002]|uniref:hypothetical protein n=1 Tax=Maribacter luteocoastalis TaxID=3407671 RepID=UPI003B6837C4
MKVQKITLSNVSVLHFLMAIVTISLLQSCKDDKKPKDKKEVEISAVADGNIVEVITETMEFQMPDTIPSGWTTWRYNNKSNQTHFILIDDWPEGKNNIDTIRQKILKPINDGMLFFDQGKVKEGQAEFGKLPVWLNQVKFPGGIGLISPGLTAETTMYLNPGKYYAECYIRMENGMIHHIMGMIKEFVVMGETSDLDEPKADYTIDISTEKGMVWEPPTSTGTYTFLVKFIDQIEYSLETSIVGLDVHLVKYRNEDDLVALEKWVDFMQGMKEPAPEGLTFLGGVNDMPRGNTGYFKATLKPGKYALISEVPMASEKNLLKTFEIVE